MDTQARFISRLPVAAHWSECWPMTTQRKDGYATFGDRSHYADIYVHRIVATAVWGPIPAGHEVDHRCRTRNCVNPFHLRVVPLALNRPGIPPEARYNRPKRTQCPHGHAYSPENTYINPSGAQVCRICLRAADARHRAKRPKSPRRY